MKNEKVSIFYGLIIFLIYDSKKSFETITAELRPNYFNSTNDDNDSFDSRSDDKGPEPEGIAIGRVFSGPTHL